MTTARHLGIVLVVLLSAVGAAGAAPAGQRQNVLFMVVDDLRCSLGCYGAADVRSPNIDRLAAKGVRFDRAYVQYPVCNPSRSSFLTGLRPDETGVLDNQTPIRRTLPDVVLLPELFHKNGYFTASLGKVIHQGINAAGRMVFHQDAKSWDDCRDFVATKTGLRGEGRNLTGGAIRAIAWLSAEGKDEDQPDGQLADAAVNVIEEHRDGPFFLAVGFHKPHDPFHAPKAYFDLYPSDEVKLHTMPADRTPDVPLAVPRNHPLRGLAEPEARELKRAYLACTTYMDAQVGRVLDALDRLKLWDSTVVVLIGDHGYHLGEHDWWNKVTVFEVGLRAPLIVWAPGARGMGRPAAGIVEFVDLYPTLADLCGLTPPARLAGTSFRPLLEDPSRPGKPAAFSRVNRGKSVGRSVRNDRWRYTEWDGGAADVELYDHDADPMEYQNLAGRPESAAVERELKQLVRSRSPSSR